MDVWRCESVDIKSTLDVQLIALRHYIALSSGVFLSRLTRFRSVKVSPLRRDLAAVVVIPAYAKAATVA